MIGTKGRIVDASFTDAPRQRNGREVNRRIKEGEGAPDDWSEAKRSQKDSAYKSMEHDEFLGEAKVGNRIHPLNAR